MYRIISCLAFIAVFACNRSDQSTQQFPAPLAEFSFNGNMENAMQSSLIAEADGKPAYVKGIDGKAMVFQAQGNNQSVTIHTGELKLNWEKDFSVQFWLQSKMDPGKRSIILSTKRVGDNSLKAQKQSGWVLGINHGNLFWNIGSGDRRLTYERDNQNRAPINDGKWHLVSLSYCKQKDEVGLYFDGIIKAIYNLNDGDGFSFGGESQLVLGWNYEMDKPVPEILPAIENGAIQIELMLDEYFKLGLGEIEPEELKSLLVDPEAFIEERVQHKDMALGNIDLEPLMEARSVLMTNPYTIFQAPYFMDVAPTLKIYSLKNGIIEINKDAAKEFTQSERLFQPDYKIDELKIWEGVLTPDEVYIEYSKYYREQRPENTVEKKSLVAAVWNIWHGGKHWTEKDHGWDSRLRIAEMLKSEGADVIMMQETYSSGDFIAAELGYYFATTADWDYLNQGSNISVLSRYPIKEVKVPEGASFMNVAAKIELSPQQEIWVMSNWYGMSEFPNVYDFHSSRFEDTDKIPVLFGGDFNAVPHTDGGDSPASEKMLESGFNDAFRSLHPDVEKYPGHSHRGGFRIDQLYFKGKGLINSSTKVISSHPDGFPSDHFLIVSEFELTK